jgi:hypothetical protein
MLLVGRAHKEPAFRNDPDLSHAAACPLPAEADAAMRRRSLKIVARNQMIGCAR